MKYVSTAELKAKLSKFLGKVREGHAIYVTHQQQPVAELRPFRKPEQIDIVPADRPVSALDEIKSLPRRKIDAETILLAERGR
jgi:antitoxin (DNA-binding transcriptional repressor) of toxin-antitoxin stability system